MAVSEKTVTQSLNIIYNYITSIKKTGKSKQRYIW